MSDLCTKFTLSGCHRFYPELPDHWYDMVEAPIRVPRFTPRKKHNREYRSRQGHVIIGFPEANEDIEQMFEDNVVEEEEQLFEDNGIEPVVVNEVEEVDIDKDVPELGIEYQAEEESVEDNDVEAIVLNEVAPIDGGDEEFTEYEADLLAAKLGGGDDNKVEL